jgi:hypothetical protein
MPNKHVTIYVGVEEEITSIVERIKKTPASEIALVIPRRSFLAQGIVNLKILKSQSEKTGKQLAIVTRDTLCRSLARKVGLETNGRLDAEILKRTKIEASPQTENQERTVYLENSFFKKAEKTNSKKINSKKKPVLLKKQKKQTMARMPNTADIIKAPIDGIKPSFTQKNRRPIKEPSKIMKKSEWEEIENFKKENQSNRMAPFLKDLSRKINFKGGKKSKRKLKQFKKIILLPTNSVNLFLLFISALVAVILIATFFILPKAEIKVVPQKELIKIDISAKIDSYSDQIDFSKNVIPGKEIKEKIETEEEFSATGTVTEEYGGDKIRGNLKVYNEFSSSLEVFVPHTRFATEEGQVFRSVSSVRLPGYTKQGGEIIPGEAIVEVIADEEGDEYQIENQKLTIPGLKGGERYEKIYAMAEEPFKKAGEWGGKKITYEDVEQGEEKISQTLEAKAKDFILKNNPDFEIIGAVILENKNIETDKRVGTKTDNFIARGECVAKALLFKRKDLEDLSDYCLAERVSKNQIFLEQNKAEITNFKIENEGKTATLDVNLRGYKADKMEKDYISDKLKGSSEEEAFEMLELIDKIESFEIKCWPFWVRSIPKKTEKIQVDITYN